MTANLLGKTLLNQYRVEAYVASGGMGTVFRVWDLQRSVPLAMKVLHADLAEDPSILKRFQREARALEKLAHPNIVHFYGLYQTLDFSFLLEAFIDGPTLKQVLRRREGKPMSVGEILPYLKAVSSALGYAHAHGVVHCDVKPGNVMVDRGGSIYLTDFGVARHAESTTTTIGYAGTAAYMAPEQIRGEAVTAATDVYALGVMVYEMLAGRRPFRGDEESTEVAGSTPSERVRYAHLQLQPPTPLKLNPDLSSAMSAVILKAMAKEPSHRYASVDDLLEALFVAAGVAPQDVSDRVQLPEIFSPAVKSEIVGPFSHVNTRIERSATGREKGTFLWEISQRLSNIVWVAIALVAVAGIILLNEIESDRERAREPEQIVLVVTATRDFIRNATPTEKAVGPKKATQTVTIPTRSPTMTEPPPPPPPTSKPAPQVPKFTAHYNMFCRAGPDTDYEEHWMVNSGQTVPVLARWENGWLLVGIDDDRTRTQCCWVGGDGTLNVNLSNVQTIGYLPDRTDCPSWP